MLDTQPDSLRVWPVYFGPACYYASRVDVSIRTLAAGKTYEIITSLPVALLNVAADAALLGSVTRIDKADLDARTLGFVEDLALQVSECPGVQDASLLAGSPYPGADAFEVFEGNTATGAFSRSNDLLRDYMVDVFGESSFFSTSFYKKSFGTFRSFPLQLAPGSIGTTTQTIKVSTREVFAVACSRYIDNANIDAKPAEGCLLFDVGYVDADEQVELLAMQNEIGFAPFVLKQDSLRVSADERDSLSTLGGPNIGYVISPRQNAGIIRDGAKWSELAFSVSVELVGVCDLGNATHNHLRAETAEFGSAFVVTELVKIELSECLSRPGAIRKPITSRVGTSKRIHKHRHLLCGWPELDLHGELHTQEIAHSILEAREKERRFLPVLKDGVSAPEIR
jgi:hypothetical protein